MDAASVLRGIVDTIERYELLRLHETLVVGVSGGPDSLCLLHVLARVRADYEVALHVAHLHHGLRGGEADADAAFVTELAGSWSLPVTVEYCDVRALAAREGLAIEETARQARYGFLGRVAIRTGATSVAVGHNADDQTETILMHWLRGAGLAGLRGILPSTPISGMHLFESDAELLSKHDINVIRPLLETPRSDIEAYCRAHDLRPRFDRSNLDTTYFRNRLRHELIPQLETYNPNLREVIRRAARIITADYDLLRALTLEAWNQVVKVETEHCIRFDLPCWRELPLSLQRSTIRQAIHRLRRSLRNINWIHVEDAVVALREKPVSTRITLPDGLMLSISYDDFVVAEADHAKPIEDHPQLGGGHLPLTIPGCTPLPSSRWHVEARLIQREDYGEEHSSNPDPWQAFLDLDQVGEHLAIRCRLPGEDFQPLGLRGRRQRIRDFMINAKIPRCVREQYPLVASPKGVIWIPGWRIDERVKVTDRTRRILYLAFRLLAET